MKRSYYQASIAEFLATPNDNVLAELFRGAAISITEEQRDAWQAEFPVLREALSGLDGMVHMEFVIPRMGRRVDAVVFIGGVVIVLEFKMGATEYFAGDIDQVYDYGLDLKNFHEGSHRLSVVPILVATHAEPKPIRLHPHPEWNGLFKPVCANESELRSVVQRILAEVPHATMSAQEWSDSRYCPTPTIIEAARALYAGHNVADISRNDAGAINLRETSQCLENIIENARSQGDKAICFVTGVPGAGKTLAGLNIATQHSDAESELHSVFLSGNGPLVEILREALTRDTVQRERLTNRKFKKGDAAARVKAFIQNVHHFRDECLRDEARPPVDHVVLFDEAQRAWDKEQTARFMKTRKGRHGFDMSEPEYLVSCMDRRTDWAVVVCLVGGGQEIHRGEAGIDAWIEAVQRSFSKWHLHISPHLTDSEYGAGKVIEELKDLPHVHFHEELHLGVSMRSFRAEKVSTFVKSVLDCEIAYARSLLQEFTGRYPIVLTRDLDVAKNWLRSRASGSERYGIVVSSQAERLKPYAMDVRTPVEPVKWFLDGKDDVRSSYYLEDVGTEFLVQGLELDWACVAWDGDFRYNDKGWQHLSFRGTRWENIKKPSRQTYQKNAYRVLLTRARQGMVIFVPKGCADDPTRMPEYYDSTFDYLKSLGLPELSMVSKR